jgi:hypothetical protein
MRLIPADVASLGCRDWSLIGSGRNPFPAFSIWGGG